MLRVIDPYVVGRLDVMLPKPVRTISHSYPSFMDDDEVEASGS